MKFNFRLTLVYFAIFAVLMIVGTFVIVFILQSGAQKDCDELKEHHSFESEHDADKHCSKKHCNKRMEKEKPIDEQITKKNLAKNFTVINASEFPLLCENESFAGGHSGKIYKCKPPNVKNLSYIVDKWAIDEGKYEVLPETFAVKVLLKSNTKYWPKPREITNILRIMNTDCHNLVKYYAIYYLEAKEEFRIVMQLYDGVDVSRHYWPSKTMLASRREREFRLSVAARDILIGLKDLHLKARIIHTDLHPQNVLALHSNPPSLPKILPASIPTQYLITDFDYSPSLDTKETKNQLIGRFTGKLTFPPFMSPEMARSRDNRWPGMSFGPKHDIFSLGVILYELWRGGGVVKNLAWQENIALARESTEIFPRGDESDLLNSFIRSAMTFNEYDRPDAQKLLEHPFITTYLVN